VKGDQRHPDSLGHEAQMVGIRQCSRQSARVLSLSRRRRRADCAAIPTGDRALAATSGGCVRGLRRICLMALAVRVNDVRLQSSSSVLALQVVFACSSGPERSRAPHMLILVPRHLCSYYQFAKLSTPASENSFQMIHCRLIMGFRWPSLAGKGLLTSMV
jgi:hypothetical protein